MIRAVQDDTRTSVFSPRKNVDTCCEKRILRRLFASWVVRFPQMVGMLAMLIICLYDLYDKNMIKNKTGLGHNSSKIGGSRQLVQLRLGAHKGPQMRIAMRMAVIFKTGRKYWRWRQLRQRQWQGWWYRKWWQEKWGWKVMLMPNGK